MGGVIIHQDHPTLNYTLVNLFNTITRAEESALAFEGLSIREVHVIEAVYNALAKKRNTMRVIADRLNITQGSLTVSVRTLERKGYLKRVTDSQDRRVTRLLPTEMCVPVQKKHVQFHSDLMKALLGNLKDDELQMLTQMLQRMYAYFNKRSFEPMIRIVCDSMSDITQAEASSLNLTVLPLHIIFNQESYLDDVSITHETFYHRLANDEQFPKTSQVTPDAFLTVFQEALDANETVLCLTGSSSLSGTYQSAIIAKGMLGDPENIVVIDSRSASVGQALLVRQAIALRDQDLDLLSIKEKILSLIPRIRVMGQVDSLKHLVRGGRLGGVSATIGTALQLKPLLTLADGKISQLGLKRGKQKILNALTSQLIATGYDKQYPVIVSSTANTAPREILKKAFVDSGIEESHIQEMAIGCVIGTHLGPDSTLYAYVE